MKFGDSGGEQLRCAACGDVIGVYEPLVHVVDGIAHRTSRAADPELALRNGGACYHVACRRPELAETLIVA